MDEHHCLQLAEESYLTVFPVKFLDIIYNNYVRGHKYVLGPTQTHESVSLWPLLGSKCLLFDSFVETERSAYHEVAVEYSSEKQLL